MKTENSCAINCFEISRDFLVRMIKRQLLKLNETLANLVNLVNLAESPVAQGDIPLPNTGGTLALALKLISTLMAALKKNEVGKGVPISLL